MSAYLYPNLPSKKAYKEAIAAGKKIVARENTPMGQVEVCTALVQFEGPHYPEHHKFYGVAKVVDYRVVKIVQ